MLGFTFVINVLVVNVPRPPLLARRAENFVMREDRPVRLHHLIGDARRNRNISPTQPIARKVTIDNLHGLPSLRYLNIDIS